MMAYIGMWRCHTRGAPCAPFRGQVIVEYAIVFPIILLLTLLIIQLAHIFVAGHIVSYAAFVAARAAIVNENPDEAAALVCSRIAGPTGVGTGGIDLPGWGELRGYYASQAKTYTIIITDEDFQLQNPDSVTVEVWHDFELRVPVADMVAYRLGDMFLTSDVLDRSRFGAPHIRMRSRSTLARPWSP